MCLLSFLPPGVVPDTAALRNGTVVNDDGHGFAIVTAEGLIVRHGLDGDAVIDAFAAARADHPHGPALFHSRLATHGDTSTGNCHPFAVGGDERTVIAHNGILPPAVQPGNADSRSDTRITAEDFIPGLGSLRHRRTRLRLQRWMGAHNKIVVLSADRRFRQPAYLLNEQAGIWDGGIWYSNAGYLPALPYHWAGLAWPPVLSAAEATDDGVISCPGCHRDIDWPDTECPRCGWCLDCASALRDCQCFLPTTLGRPSIGRPSIGRPSIGRLPAGE
jgi:hypothetical protein